MPGLDAPAAFRRCYKRNDSPCRIVAAGRFDCAASVIDHACNQQKSRCRIDFGIVITHIDDACIVIIGRAGRKGIQSQTQCSASAAVYRGAVRRRRFGWVLPQIKIAQQSAGEDRVAV